MDSFMTRSDEAQPASVPTVAQTIMAQQAGEPQFLWGWGERTVWTERMLKALTDSQGEGMKKMVWFRLIDTAVEGGFARRVLGAQSAGGL